MKKNAIKRVPKIVTPKKDFTLATTLTWAKSSVLVIDRVFVNSKFLLCALIKLFEFVYIKIIFLATKMTLSLYRLTIFDDIIKFGSAKKNQSS